MAQVQKLRGDASVIDHDRRVSADEVASAPLDLAANVVAKDYPPAAVTALFIVKIATVFALGRLAATMFGVGGAESPLGPHQLIFAAAAILFPAIAGVEGSFTTRPRGITALWGMRLIAPLVVAQFASLAVFAALHPTLPLAPSEPALLQWFADLVRGELCRQRRARHRL